MYDTNFCLSSGIYKFIIHPYNHFTMLNYVKTVLTKVSFDALLFEKELRKAIQLLVAEEISELRNWCYSRFTREHEAILNRCFNTR